MNFVSLPPPKLLVSFVLLLTLSACGGGGGGSKQFSLDRNNIQFEATEGQGTPQSEIVVGTVRDVNQSIFVYVLISENGVIESADVSINESNGTGTVRIFPKSPNTVGAGEYDDVVTVLVCFDQNCDSQVSGSPQTINISYIIEAGPDADNDGRTDSLDAFPDDPSEQDDSDNDGVGDNADELPDDASDTKDSDGDGVGDSSDAFPDDASESSDSDDDGVGDNADDFPNDANETNDSDGDGTGDNSDAFPDDSNETVDSDSDGTGDNADAFPDDSTETTDSDNDGTGDNADEFPDDPNETSDRDRDGVGDNADALPDDPNESTDSDNDGIGDNSDEFPTDPNEYKDVDGDNIGSNKDDDDTDAEVTSSTLATLRDKPADLSKPELIARYALQFAKLTYNAEVTTFARAEDESGDADYSTTRNCDASGSETKSRETNVFTHTADQCMDDPNNGSGAFRIVNGTAKVTCDFGNSAQGCESGSAELANYRLLIGSIGFDQDATVDGTSEFILPPGGVGPSTYDVTATILYTEVTTDSVTVSTNYSDASISITPSDDFEPESQSRNLAIDGGAGHATFDLARCLNGSAELVTNSAIELNSNTGNPVSGSIQLTIPGNENAVVNFQTNGSATVQLGEETTIVRSEVLSGICQAPEEE